jgi:hypothetical protein
VGEVTRGNEQLEKLALDTALEHRVGYELHDEILAHARRPVKRHDERFLLSVQVEVAFECVDNRVLDQRLSEQVLVQILVQHAEVVAQVGLRAAFVQTALDVLENVETLLIKRVKFYELLFAYQGVNIFKKKVIKNK